MFEAIDRVLNNAINLSEQEAWFFAIDNDEVKDEIIRINTQDQLFEEGIDSLGVTLGDYSEASVEIYGKPEGHIRLFDEGDFYDSFVVVVTPNGFFIAAQDDLKSDRPLTETYGPEILGITDENMEFLKEFIIPKYREYVRQKLFS